MPTHNHLEPMTPGSRSGGFGRVVGVVLGLVLVGLVVAGVLVDSGLLRVGPVLGGGAATTAATATATPGPGVVDLGVYNVTVVAGVDAGFRVAVVEGGLVELWNWSGVDRYVPVLVGEVDVPRVQVVYYRLNALSMGLWRLYRDPGGYGWGSVYWLGRSEEEALAARV
ncbi:MAG: hypothetical protein F7B18_05230, partial [Desulfurococcales archaeon]|nr:hypothetical protein [Desulfurococcales archaeon]